MVDVTWATSKVYRRIYNWRVAEGVETLSDHLYIRMEVALETTSAATEACSIREVNRSRLSPRRWRLKKRDKEMPYSLREALTRRREASEKT